MYTEAKMFKDGPNTKAKDKPCLSSFCYEPIHILEKSENLDQWLFYILTISTYTGVEEKKHFI